MIDPLSCSDSNSYNEAIEDILDSSTEHETMSLKELNLQIDSELLEITISDILNIPACLRSAAIEDFAEIDPALAAKLRLELLFIQD